jgi:hypothetical protein
MPRNLLAATQARVARAADEEGAFDAALLDRLGDGARKVGIVVASLA